MNVTLRALAVCLGLALCVGAAPPATAQTSRPFASGSGDAMLRGTKAELEALKSAENDKYIRARTQAEKILDGDPSSFIATYVLSLVHHYEEGNNPRALYLLEKARRTLEERYGHAPPRGAEAQQWHRKLLKEANWLLGEMDRLDAQIKVLDTYDALYKPPLTRERIWPLMKLKRDEEAIGLARQLTLSNKVGERVSGYNGWAAVEAEAFKRKGRFDVMSEGIRNTQERSCILLHNGSDAALGMYDFTGAEQLAKKALKAEIEDCPKQSYSRMVPLYLIQGELKKAISGLEKMQQSPVEKRYRQQFHMEAKTHLTEVLWAVGRFDKALELIDQVVQAPDRTGMTSLDANVNIFQNRYLQSLVLAGRIEQEKERASVRPLLSKVASIPAQQLLALRKWEADRVVVQSVGNGDLLVASLRPYMRGIMPWYQGHLPSVLGEGVLEAALTEAERIEAAEEGSPISKSQGFFAAIRGEAAWRAGKLTRALELANEALTKLPKETKLLRMRITAWQADAALQRGDLELAKASFLAVVKEFPTTLRHLGIALPVGITSDGSAIGEEVAKRLLGSRRLTEGTLGFEVRVRETPRGPVEMCLGLESGHQFGCVFEEVPKGDKNKRKAAEGPAAETEAAAPEESDRVARLCDLFHEKAFAPGVELTQSDINTLDGSPSRGDVDDVLKGVLGVPGEEKKAEEDKE